MRRVEHKISPAAYARLRDHLLSAELSGYGPTECAAMAMSSIGIGPSHWPPEPQETVLIVDPTLDGPVYPFMEWSAELKAARNQ